MIIVTVTEKNMFETFIFICLFSWRLAGKYFNGISSVYVIMCSPAHYSVTYHLNHLEYFHVLSG